MPATTLSISRAIYKKAAKKSQEQHLSLSAVARMLLEAYSEGKIRIMAISIDQPISLREVPDGELTPAMKKSAQRAYRMKRRKLMNI